MNRLCRHRRCCKTRERQYYHCGHRSLRGKKSFFQFVENSPEQGAGQDLCFVQKKHGFGVVKYGQGHKNYWKYKGIVGLITFERNAIGLLPHSANECSSFDGIAPFEPSNMRILLAREWTQPGPSVAKLVPSNDFGAIHN